MTRKLKPMICDNPDRGFASMTHAAAMAVALCFFALAPALAADQLPTPAPAMAPSPAAAPKGEVDDSTPAASGQSTGDVTKPSKAFTEEDVDKRVSEVIADRSKDGAFVFHDPKLNVDLNLMFEQIKIVRGMEGYGWFANTIFHDRDEPKKQYPSISGSSLKVTS
ncbi:MAG: hypothetical protein WA717_13310 [Methyloceanibacter sp.]